MEPKKLLTFSQNHITAKQATALAREARTQCVADDARELVNLIHDQIHEAASHGENRIKHFVPYNLEQDSNHFLKDSANNSMRLRHVDFVVNDVLRVLTSDEWGFTCSRADDPPGSYSGVMITVEWDE